MYIQITDRCNMTCEHCGFACTDKGTDMDKNTFMAALKMSGEYIIIGGGEPTIHPEFWDFLVEAIAGEWVENVWMVTNGSMTETSLKLARLAKKGVIACELSQDSYHDAIDGEVYQAFSELDNGIRNTEMNIINAGRAKENQLVANNDCVCTDKVIQPNGDIRLCGCLDAPIVGNVHTGIIGEWEDRCYEVECHQELLEEV